MATIQTIRSALAAQVTTAGLTCHPSWPGTITPPCAVIMRDTTTHGLDMTGATRHTLTIHAYVTATTQHAATGHLDDALDTIHEALAADHTIAGTCDYATPTTTGSETLTTIGAADYLTARVSVEILT